MSLLLLSNRKPPLDSRGLGMSEYSASSWTDYRELAETAVYDQETPRSRPGAGVEFVSGQRPSLADETITLLRSRLRALCWVMVISLGLFLLRTVLLQDAPLVSVRLAVLAVAIGMIAYLRHPHSHSLSRLRVVELVGLAVLAIQSILLQVAGMLDGARAANGQQVLSATFASFTVWGIIVMSYGFFIPNSSKRAAAIIVPAVLTPLLTTIVLWQYRPQVAALLDWKSVVTAALMTGIAGLAAVYGTYTVAALRRESFAARRFGQYQLRRRLGGGGMGEVYLAEHALLKRPCAIKLIRTEHEADAVAVARFESEVHATANLSHWNTIDIFDYGRTRDGAFYYVMEYLPGLSLQELVLQFGPLPPQRLVYLLRQTCQGLAEAHATGLVHRDIKPGNIFVAHRGGQYDVAKLLDFGLVAQFREGTQFEDPHAAPGSVSGTPLYMSPEQTRFAAAIDGRSDIYSLGATAYFALTSMPPFTASELHKILSAHQTAELVSPREVAPGLPDDLCSIVTRNLAKDPTDRYATVVELEQALAQCACAGQWGPEEAACWWAQHADAEQCASSRPEPISLHLQSDGGTTVALE
jgi:eukaryotic-like serine/threonine-protein kinase